MSRILAEVQATALTLYAKIIHLTSPQYIEGWSHIDEAMETHRPVVFAAWHGQFHLHYALARRKFEVGKLTVVRSADSRGEVLKCFSRRIGTQSLPVDMEDASIAAARKVVQVIKKLGAGRFVYIAPDGPDGPARVAKPGVAFIARQARGLVVPAASGARHAGHIPRWDRYVLPLPFDRIYSVIGPAIDSQAYPSLRALLVGITDGLNAINARVETLMNSQL